MSRSENHVSYGDADEIVEPVRSAVDKQRTQSISSLIERPHLEEEGEPSPELEPLAPEAFGAGPARDALEVPRDRGRRRRIDPGRAGAAGHLHRPATIGTGGTAADRWNWHSALRARQAQETEAARLVDEARAVADDNKAAEERQQAVNTTWTEFFANVPPGRALRERDPRPLPAGAQRRGP